MSTSQNVFTVVSGMDEVHIGMGSVLNILHTYGVWVLQGIAEEIFLLDIAGQVVFLVDIVLQFFVAYRDSQTYNMIYKRTPIALRYLKSTFVFDLLACMPWDLIYKDYKAYCR